MKKTAKTFTCLAALAALSTLASCNREVQAPMDQSATEGTMSVSIGGDFATKADSDNSFLAFECRMQDVQLLVFDADRSEKGGRIQRYFRFDENSVNNNSTSSAALDTTFTLPVGNKIVCALVNGPDVSDIGYYDDLGDVEAFLTDYHSKSALMHYGSSNCSVTSTNSSDKPAECTVDLVRNVARVHLAGVTNSLAPYYGDLSIDRIFLANVKNDISLDRETDFGTWSNVYGQIELSNTIFDTSPDDCVVARGETLSPTDSYSYFYCYPNSCTDFSDHAGSTEWEEQSTCLVLVGTVLGESFYYPIALGNLEANTAYDVYLEVKSLGSDDPATPVKLGNLKVNLRMGGWLAGEAISVTI